MYSRKGLMRYLIPHACLVQLPNKAYMTYGDIYFVLGFLFHLLLMYKTLAIYHNVSDSAVGMFAAYDLQWYRSYFLFSTQQTHLLNCKMYLAGTENTYRKKKTWLIRALDSGMAVYRRPNVLMIARHGSLSVCGRCHIYCSFSML